MCYNFRNNTRALLYFWYQRLQFFHSVLGKEFQEHSCKKRFKQHWQIYQSKKREYTLRGTESGWALWYWLHGLKKGCYRGKGGVLCHCLLLLWLQVLQGSLEFRRKQGKKIYTQEKRAWVCPKEDVSWVPGFSQASVFSPSLNHPHLISLLAFPRSCAIL